MGNTVQRVDYIVPSLQYSWIPFSGPHCPRLPRDLARGRSAASRSGHDAATASNAAAAATATQQESESERVSPPRAPAAPPQLEVLKKSKW